ncbi:hypothetical protein FMN50_20265 [Rhodobacterales bacterium]|nr:hypothetical protein FMN50_20265 [Rhodobacterales bacterium]
MASGLAELRPFRPGERRENPDGSHSTELTTTWQLGDGNWVNVPSLWMGADGPVEFDQGDEQTILGAMSAFEGRNGPTFKRFTSLDEAEAADRVRSEQGGAGAVNQRPRKASSFFRTIEPADAEVFDGEAGLPAIANAARETAVYVDNLNARILSRTEAFDDAVKSIRKATGIELENPQLDTQSTPLHRDPIRGDPYQAWERRIAEIIEQHPDQAEILEPFRLEGIEKAAEEKARSADERYQVLSSTRDDWAGFGAGLAGGIGGSFQDPATILTLPFGLGAGSARTVAGKVLATTWREALVAGSTEAAMQPFVQKWREDAGLPHGLGEGVKNVAAATLFGGLVGGTLRGAIETPGAIRRVRSRRFEAALPKPDPDKIADDLLSIRDSLPAATRAALDVFDENRTVIRAIRAELGDDLSADFGRMMERADRFAETLDASDPEDFARFIRDRELAEDPRLAGDFERARADLEAAQKTVADLENPLNARTMADTLEDIDPETAARVRAIEDELNSEIPAKRRADLEAERRSIVETIGEDVLERTERNFRIGPEKQVKRARKKLREARRAFNAIQRKADARAGGRLEAGRALARAELGDIREVGAPGRASASSQAAPARPAKADPFEPDSPEAADQVAALEGQLSPDDEISDLLFVQDDGLVTAESRTVADALEEADRGNYLSDLVKACKLS